MILLRRASVLSLIMFSTLGAFSQKNFAKDADAAYRNEAYYSAIDMYNIAETGESNLPEKANINSKIAEAYRRLNIPSQAAFYENKATEILSLQD